LFSCSGIGVINRGIESFFLEAFTHLKEVEGVEALLLKGDGETRPDERVVPCLPRTSERAVLLGHLASRSPYVVEQWTTFLPVAFHIRRFRPHVVFYSDQNLGFLLYWLRRYIGVPYRLLFSNGAPCSAPFRRLDFVHQVAPCYYDEAIARGEPTWKHVMVPYGINIVPPPTRLPGEQKAALRRALGLPTQGTILLSVGWISREHKRMDYVIQELARLPQPRPFLMLVGAMDKRSDEIVQMAKDSLGSDACCIRSVPYHEVFNYYKASDYFVLASLKEGFGRVYLEALLHGLPVIAHRHPVTEFVLGNEGRLVDLSRPGKLADAMASLQGVDDPAAAKRRWRFVKDCFGWQNLAAQYRSMFSYVRLSKELAMDAMT
jgi:glycosyltransferase involved in cell wall biosynthesis